ncbi:PIN domain-containing protein [Mycobacteroides abscessus subsp. abscessus]|uniref:type II toxin-antitoxin system VapC family toxin n=1 Tax=Mycobacteroides abscessus TaxID=36809 RepID=UPI0009268CCE|nr:PIN domain-containing protein [Mycobacteroides abscessus]MEC4857115.1 PIN domain-containing protein [Mycobacteroides chelonae]MBN7403644.1 PIN domain-containing protein [Mycobacteroides abscessus subsp. abscessus]MDO3087202.1 PIN domain-containing protein [Mycobacteroides abscessus subsp. abscessus]MDO3269208.1 PIN domain-containing protein [Mycobacteroides abscessus subsp. abscessus]MEC4873525.1 PIN domain-containing protein [Mycobacteroides chelonae]
MVSKQRTQTPPPKVYVDTSVYLDLLAKETQPHPTTRRPRWESAKALFDAVNSDRVVLAASALIEAEVNCVAVVRDGDLSIHELVRGWFTAESTIWTDVDRFLARDAAKLAKQWGPYSAKGKKLGGADATHLAAAVRLDCDYLMTQDAGFPIGQTVGGVKVILPEEVWPRDLLDELEDRAAAKSAVVKKKPPKAIVVGKSSNGQVSGQMAALPVGKSASAPSKK